MALNLQSHVWTKDSKTGQAVIGKVNHCADLAKMGEPRIFLQSGKAYYGDGTEIQTSELPPWVFEEIARMSPTTRRNIGWMEQTNAASSSPSAQDMQIEETHSAAEPEVQAPVGVPVMNPRDMKFFGLRAWAKREHGIEGASRDEILDQLVRAGIIGVE